jgi:hypothetical protein
MNMPLLRDLYTLTATLDGTTTRKSVQSDNDGDAIQQAVGKIMAYAMKSDTWAKGFIVLTDPEGRQIGNMNEGGGFYDVL